MTIKVIQSSVSKRCFVTIDTHEELFKDGSIHPYDERGGYKFQTRREAIAKVKEKFKITKCGKVDCGILTWEFFEGELKNGQTNVFT